jgi:hypothetical protein
MSLLSESARWTILKPEGRLFRAESWWFAARILSVIVLYGAAFSKMDAWVSIQQSDRRGLELLLILAEFLLASWLVLGCYPFMARIVAFGCFLSFALVSLSKGIGGSSSCGCFGRMHSSPWIVLIIDIAICGLLYASKPASGSGARLHGRVMQTGIIGLSFLTLIGLMNIRAAPTLVLPTEGVSIDSLSGTIVLSPESWHGKGFPLFDLANLPSSVKTGRWYVFLYQQDCPHCQQLLDAIRRTSKPLSNVALVAVPPYGEDGPHLNLPGEVVHRHLPISRDWFVQAPLAVELLDGRVEEVEAPLADPVADSFHLFMRGRPE